MSPEDIKMFYHGNFFKRIAEAFAVSSIFVFLAVSLSASSCAWQRRYVLIDGGAYQGGTLTAFKTTDLYSRHHWEMFAIEANPALIDKIPQSPDVTVMNKAVWVEDGTVSFNVNTKEDHSSSILRANEDTVELTVESIDFGKWLQRNFEKKDYVIVSFDIEGAEYEVLNKMLNDGTIHYVDKLYCEFHDNGGWPQGLSEREKELVARIKKLGIMVRDISIDDLIGRDIHSLE